MQLWSLANAVKTLWLASCIEFYKSLKAEIIILKSQ